MRRKLAKKSLGLSVILVVLVSLCTGVFEGNGKAEAVGLTASASTEEQAGNTENLFFLGDSLLYNPEEELEIFSRNGHQILAGIGSTLPQFFGVTREDVTVGMRGHQVTGTIKNRDFNGIVILMGTNDLAGASPLVVFDHYEELLEELRKDTPAPIYVMRVFPSNAHYERTYGDYIEKNNNVRILNGKLNEYCDNNEGVFFIDATRGFIDADGLFLHDYGDGLHMHPDYYEQFYDNILEAVKDTQPERRKERPEYYDESQLEQHWAFPSIQYALETGLFSGFPDGSFRPNAEISRSMFVTVLGRAAEVSAEYDKEDVPFADILPGDYFRPYVAWASDNGIVFGGGDDGTLFNPEGLMTREQMAMMLGRFMKTEGILPERLSETGWRYTDQESIDPRALEGVRACTARNLMNGDEEGCFRPDEYATRAETSVILLRVKFLLWQHTFCKEWPAS